MVWSLQHGLLHHSALAPRLRLILIFRQLHNRHFTVLHHNLYFFHEILKYLHLTHFLHLLFHITNNRRHFIFLDQRSYLRTTHHHTRCHHHQLHRPHRQNPTHLILATKELPFHAHDQYLSLLNFDE